MEITVIGFGIAKDIMGQQKINLSIDEKCTVQQLKSLLFEKYPGFINVQSIKIALNETYANDDELINSNDEVVIIPPVSGG